jgi:hypothetical protein
MRLKAPREQRTDENDCQRCQAEAPSIRDHFCHIVQIERLTPFNGLLVAGAGLCGIAPK